MKVYFTTTEFGAREIRVIFFEKRARKEQEKFLKSVEEWKVKNPSSTLFKK